MSGYDELIGSQETPEAPVAETPQAPEPVVTEAPAEPSEPAPVEAQAPPAQEPQQDHSVPLNVLLRTREEFGGKLTQAEARAQAAERQLQAILKQREEAAAQAPNLLDDPDGYHAYWENRHRALEQGFQQRLQQTITRERIEGSMERWTEKLGEEEFNKLRAWSATMPPQWVKHAENQRDPFGFAKKEFDKQQEAKRARELIAQTGGKSIDEIVAERVAAELAKHQAAPAPQAAAPAPGQPRAPDGKFAPLDQTQRHQPPSLSVVAGAAAPTGEESRGGYESLFKRG